MESEQVQPSWIRVNLGVMAMKRYSTLYRDLELKPHYQMLFSIMPRTW